MCSPLGSLFSPSPLSHHETCANTVLENRLVNVFKPVGTFKDGILTCPAQIGSELTIIGIDDNGVLIFTSHCYKNSIMVRDDIEVTVNFNLKKLALNPIRDIKIIYT